MFSIAFSRAFTRTSSTARGFTSVATTWPEVRGREHRLDARGAADGRERGRRGTRIVPRARVSAARLPPRTWSRCTVAGVEAVVHDEQPEPRGDLEAGADLPVRDPSSSPSATSASSGNRPERGLGLLAGDGLPDVEERDERRERLGDERRPRAAHGLRLPEIHLAESRRDPVLVEAGLAEVRAERGDRVAHRAASEPHIAPNRRAISLRANVAGSIAYVPARGSCSQSALPESST